MSVVHTKEIEKNYFSKYFDSEDFNTKSLNYFY